MAPSASSTPSLISTSTSASTSTSTSISTINNQPSITQMICEPPTGSTSYKHKPIKVFHNLPNRSKDKIENSFDRLESSPTKLQKTRSTTQQLGLRSKNMHGQHPSFGYKIMNMKQLLQSLESSAICRKCKDPKSKLSFFDNPASRKGLSEKLTIKCSICDNSTECNTSEVGPEGTAHDINTRSVYFSTKQGIGLAGLNDLSSNFDLPPPITAKPYNTIIKKISDKSIAEAETLMNNAAKKLFDYVKKNEPKKIEHLHDKEVANVDVTIDGTWQKRGHNSKIGVVFAMSVLTGEVLDYEVKNLFCHHCTRHQDENKSSDAYLTWYAKHKKNCPINHVGSSGSMENAAAVEMFLRSIDNRSLKYSTFVGDGDTGSFGQVKEKCLQKYGDNYIVVKEECVGHIQKRMGSGLREYKRKKKGIKLSDNKTCGGKGRLTDRIIDKMQNYYGEAIRHNVGNPVAMKNAILATFKHMVKHPSENLNAQHELCPRGENSWCSYWRDHEAYDDSKRLPSAFYSELIPLYTRLSGDELLERCQRGLTQNQNEAINHVLWNKCPKTKFCGISKVYLAVSETVSQFNSGAASQAHLLKSVGVKPSENMIRLLRKKDDVRVKQAAKKISEKARMRRRKLRANKKNQSETTTTSYLSGSFGLSKNPEKLISRKKLKTSRKAPIRSANNVDDIIDFAVDVEIKFIHDSDVLLLVVV